jgi:DNA-binding IclR family transcriptional regulator
MLRSLGMATRQARSRKTYQVPALKRAFAIFDSLNHTSFGLTVQEVSQEHDIPYSTAFYLLETMRECGYAQRSEDSKKYRLGHKALSLRESNLANYLLDLRTIARPMMEEVSVLTGLTIHLAILERDEAVYIEKVEPRGFVRLYTWIGKRNSLHCTAVGKALLMCLTEEEVRAICKPGTLIRRTERTIVSIDPLLKELRHSAERGYAIDDIEDEPEGRAVAAPIYNGQGNVVASLGVAGSLSQLEFSRLDAIGKLVHNYAERTSLHLGHRSTLPASIGS